jgi:hypothetical protein
MFLNPDDYFEDAFDDDDFRADEEALGEIRKEKERINALPVMKQAKAIFTLVQALLESLPDENDFADHYRDVMWTDAATISAKINSAEAMDFYSLKMENAVLAKVAAQNLSNQVSGLAMLELASEEYCQLLRDEVEEFRKVFVDWVAGFTRTPDLPDEWGLFASA